jgi:diguanylate cyclase (GGDEF)-like protein/PAS domain S-box-containing protein
MSRLTLSPTNTIDELLSAASDGILVADGEQLLFINPAARAQLQLSAQELPSLKSLLVATPGLVDWLVVQVVERGIAVLQNACFFTPEGVEQHLEISASRITYADRVCILLITRAVAQQQDLETRFSRLNRLYAMLNQTSKAVTRLTERQQLFDEMCRIAVEEGGFRMAWIGLIKDDLVSPSSYAGAELGYLQRIQVRVDNSDLARGPVGRAALEGSLQWVNDALNDPSFLPWKEAATARGFQSLAALPITLNHHVIGVFALYARDSHVFDEDMLDVLSSMGKDINFVLAHLEYEQQRRLSEARLKQLSLAVEQSSSAIIITDKSGIIEYVNQRFTQLTGYHADHVVGLTTDFLSHGEAAKETWRLIQTHISHGKEWFGELRTRTREGDYFWGLQRISPIRDEDNRTTHYVINIDDNTELHDAQETITRLAYYDPLTDLPNRRMLYDRMEQAVLSAQRDHCQLALLYLDLDGFKAINDTLGHANGDRLLQIVSRRLSEAVRGKDTVARLGGDEFTILLTDIRCRNAVENVAKKIVQSLQQPIQLGDSKVQVTTSIGVTICPEDAKTVDQLMRYADMALYRAKDKGRNTYQFYTPELQQLAQQRRSLEDQLLEALEQNQFVLNYQPQVCLSSGAIVCVEALIRWQHPERGLLAPHEFIPIATSSGLTQRIGLWGLKQAVKEAAQLQAQWPHPLKVALNLSTYSIKLSHTLLENIQTALQRTHLPAHLLELELNASIAGDNLTQTVSLLHSLKAIGLSLTIDDFGYGYSLLDHLSHLPVDRLKISPAFIKHLSATDNTNPPREVAIITAILDLAEKLNLHVIATGVETQAQADFLASHRCAFAQGNWFSRPLTLQALMDFLQS